MANLPESASFDAGIYQIETTDAVIGGVNGISNLQAKALANRTTWLKQQVNALNALKGKGIAAHSTGSSYAGGDQVIYQKNIWQANTAITPGAFNPANWTRQLGNAAEVDISTTSPAALGSAAVGASTTLARSDHVHAMPTLDALANTLITSNANGEILRWNGTNWINNTLAEAGIAPISSPTFTGVLSAQRLELGSSAAPTQYIDFHSGAVDIDYDSRIIATGGTGSSGEGILSIEAGKLALPANTNGTTQAPGTNNTQMATTAFVAALGALKANLASPALTGTPTAPTATAGTNTTQLATTAFVQSQIASSFTAASETVAGNVELATAAETTTGTDNTRAVHPAGLKVELDKKAPLASPALTGTPTAPTAATGTRSTAIATMQNFANEFGSSLAANGYQKLPSGLIIQWGSLSVNTDAKVEVVFPVAFPNAFLNAHATAVRPSAANQYGVFVNSMSTTGLSIINDGQTTTVYWMALGY